MLQPILLNIEHFSSCNSSPTLFYNILPPTILNSICHQLQLQLNHTPFCNKIIPLWTMFSWLYLALRHSLKLHTSQFCSHLICGALVQCYYLRLCPPPILCHCHCPTSQLWLEIPEISRSQLYSSPLYYWRYCAKQHWTDFLVPSNWTYLNINST